MSGLETAAYQVGLWTDPEQEQSRRLQPVLDELRERFGRQAIQRGSQLFRDKSEETQLFPMVGASPDVSHLRLSPAISKF